MTYIQPLDPKRGYSMYQYQIFNPSEEQVDSPHPEQNYPVSAQQVLHSPEKR